MKFKRQKSEEISVNLTPLIDVVFLLLIFFMVSTTFNKETHIDLTLPKADSATETQDQKSIDIVIDADGQYQVNGKSLANTQAMTLKRAIEEVAGQDKNLPLFITADAETTHQSVVTAMDVAGQLGFDHMSITTQKAQGE